MPHNNAHRAKVSARRRRVAELRLRQLTQTEIAEALQDTDTPASVATVNRDIKFLETEWRQDAARDMATLKGNHVAELREARRVAWRGKDGKTQLFYVLKSLEQEARVLKLEDMGNEDMERWIQNFQMGAETMRQLYHEKQVSANGNG